MLSIRDLTLNAKTQKEVKCKSMRKHNPYKK